MNKVTYLILLVCSLLLPTSLWAKTSPQPIDSIVAIVNDGVITHSELSKAKHLAFMQLKERGIQPPPEAVIEKESLDKLITNKLQLQLATKMGIRSTENQVDETIAQIAKQNRLTVNELRREMDQEGISYKDFRNNLREDWVINQVQQREIGRSLVITTQEVDQFLNSPNGLGNQTKQYHLGHILVSLPENPSPKELKDTENTAKRLVAKLKSGLDFNQVSAEDLKEQQTIKSGELDWRPLGELPTYFVSPILSLKQGEYHAPIRSPSGFHIIKLIAKRDAPIEPLKIEKTLARHILIKTDAMTNDEDAKARLNGLLVRLENGEDFAILAKTHSQDLASASSGGELGWVTPDALVPEFSSQMDALKPNQISNPFKSPFGWHITEVLDRKIHDASADAMKHKAKQMIYARKFDEHLESWLQQLHDESYIQVLI